VTLPTCSFIFYLEPTQQASIFVKEDLHLKATLHSQCHARPSITGSLSSYHRSSKCKVMTIFMLGLGLKALLPTTSTDPVELSLNDEQMEEVD